MSRKDTMQNPGAGAASGHDRHHLCSAVFRSGKEPLLAQSVELRQISRQNSRHTQDKPPGGLVPCTDGEDDGDRIDINQAKCSAKMSDATSTPLSSGEISRFKYQWTR